MAFKIERFGSNTSNVKNMFGGTNDYRYYNKDNNTLTTPGYFPGTLGLEVGDRIRVTPSVKTNPDEIYIVTDVTNGVVTVTQVDTDGAVDSVNGKTGNVVLTSEDILPSQTGYSGRILGTDGFVAGWVVPEEIQRSALPQASEDELGNIYQFKGATDSTYTNGYFYKCVSDGQTPATYSWEQTNVQPQASGLPDQTGQSGKFLTTDGTDASWSGALPLSGGTMEGDINTNITFQNTTHYVKWTNQNNGVVYKIGAEKDGAMAQIRVGTWCLSLDENYMNSKSIFFDSSSTSTPVGRAGAIYKPLENVYTKYITAPNGSQITIPTTGGTIVVATPPSTPNTTWTLKATVDANGDYTVAWVQDA